MRLGISCSLVVLVVGVSAQASTIAYQDPTGQGTQAWGGNLALTFTVNTPITVTALGVFNASGSGTIAGAIDVAIYNLNTSSLAVGSVVFNGDYSSTLAGFDVFQPVTPTVLGPGSYEIDAVGFSGSDPNGNLNTGSSTGPTLNSGGGALTFTGANYDSSSTIDAPLTCSGCQSAPSPQDRQFDAGTFQFFATTAPEPGSFGLAASVLIAVTAVFRRRRV